MGVDCSNNYDACIFVYFFNDIQYQGIDRGISFGGFISLDFFEFINKFGSLLFCRNANIIKKVYFPRELIPVSITLSNLFNFVLSILILIILSLASGYKIGFSILYLPVVIIMQALFVSGIVLILSSLFVYYRDIKYFTEILLTIWFYLTPIFYDQKLIRGYSETLFKLFLLNPMTGLIVMYRDILMYGSFPSIYLTGFTFFLCVVFFIAGMALNSKLSGFYADYV